MEAPVGSSPRLPRWVRGALGVVLVLVGATLIGRPTTSLGVLALLIGFGLALGGAVTLLSGDDGGRAARASRIAVGALLLLAGVFVFAFPGLTVRTVALVVAGALLLGGARDVVDGFGRAAAIDARVSSWASGAAGLVFGVLALAWPDITLLVVAVVFGARLVILGATTAWTTLRPAAQAPSRPPGLVRRWTRTAVSVGALALSLVAAGISVNLHGGSPVVDDFYAAPRVVPDGLGQLIRSEPFTTAVPPDAQAWRILYTTQRGDGTAAVASALVVVPRTGDGGWPVIAWTHGTTGFAENCAPSLQAKPFESGALFLLPTVIQHGWALVATDYIGLGTPGPHPYLIGPDSAHAELDAIRAARRLANARLGSKTVSWGHSQGGGAALWAGALAATYAPDVPLSGVAALAPASNLTALIDNLPNVTGGSVFASYVIAAYTATYPDVTWREYVRPGAEATVRAMAGRCLSEPGVLVSVLQAMALARDPEIMAKPADGGAFGERLRQNTPPPTISAPLLIGQGAADSLVVPSAQDAYVAGLCAAGQQVDYRTYAGRDHVPLVEPDSPLVPDLIAWTTDRFEGTTVEPGCTRQHR